MEIQLQELIEQIKKNGVEAAQDEAQAVLDAAKAQAEHIIADAKSQAEKILSDAKSETARMIKSGEDALSQAGRNVLLSFRESMTRELRSILNHHVDAIYSSEALTSLIKKAIEGLLQNPDTEDIAVVLSPADLKALEEAAFAEIQAGLQKGVILKASDSFDGGFRICAGDSSAYYDYSREAVVDMLAKYLSPKVARILKEAE